MVFIELMLNGKGRHAECLAEEPLELIFLLPQFVTVVRERGYSGDNAKKASGGNTNAWLSRSRKLLGARGNSRRKAANVEASK